MAILFALRKGDKGRDPFSHEQAQEIRELASRFLGFWNRNRLFVSESLCVALMALSWKSGQFGQDNLFHVVDPDAGDLTQEASEWFQVKKELPVLINRVESEFKRLVGGETVTVAEGEKED